MPAPAPPRVVAMASAAAATCSATDSANKIAYYSDASYQPGPGVAPPPVIAFPPGSTYVQDLVAVFNANPSFQRQLCKLDAVYVNGATCTSPEQCTDSSWGWRQSKPTIGAGRAVALSTALWQETSFSKYETDLMQTILPQNGAFYSGAKSCSSGTCTSVDTLTTALMAGLAHEVGHVLWYDLVSQYNPSTNSYSDPNSFCGGTFFPVSWQVPVSPPPQWRTLLTPQQRARANWPNTHKIAPHIRDIDQSGNGYYRANLTLGLFETTQPWVSVFAALSPDEDFVETYKFIVLASAAQPLNSVTITLPTLPPSYANAAADYAAGRKAGLATKVACINQALAGYR
jgi:hypothetical protein